MNRNRTSRITAYGHQILAPDIGTANALEEMIRRRSGEAGIDYATTHRNLRIHCEVKLPDPIVGPSCAHTLAALDLLEHHLGEIFALQVQTWLSSRTTTRKEDQ